MKITNFNDMINNLNVELDKKYYYNDKASYNYFLDKISKKIGNLYNYQINEGERVEVEEVVYYKLGTFNNKCVKLITFEIEEVENIINDDFDEDEDDENLRYLNIVTKVKYIN